MFIRGALKYSPEVLIPGSCVRRPFEWSGRECRCRQTEDGLYPTRIAWPLPVPLHWDRARVTQATHFPLNPPTVASVEKPSLSPPYSRCSMHIFLWQEKRSFFFFYILKDASVCVWLCVDAAVRLKRAGLGPLRITAHRMAWKSEWKLWILSDWPSGPNQSAEILEFIPLKEQKQDFAWNYFLNKYLLLFSIKLLCAT